MEEVPAPKAMPGCVLVRIAASVVSAGTERASAEFARKSLLQKAQSRPDLVREVISKVQRDGVVSAIQAVRSRLDQPQGPGYSSSGTVVEVGEGVTDLQPGDRVSCAGAGYAVHAEFACIPRLLVARIPPGDPATGGEVTFDEAAFATLGAVALHGIRTAEAKLGDLVAVIGLGLLGQLTVQLLKAAGCRVVGLDMIRERAELAGRMGADAVVTSASSFRDICSELSRGMGADAVLITAETPSSEPVNLAGAVARDRGIVVAVGTVGIEIERKTYYEKELDFRVSRSYGPGRYDSAYEQKGRDYPIGYVRWTETRNMDAFLQLVLEKKVDVGSLITHRFPIDQAQSAYQLITGRSGERFLGVVIQYLGTANSLPTVAVRNAVRSGQFAGKCEMTVGALGAGVFATGTLLPAIKASSARLKVICAATGSHAHHAARKFGFECSTTDESEVLRDQDVNTIVITTRHHLHAQQVMDALAAGKHVFCEKPLCLSEDELRQIVRKYVALSAVQPVLMVGFNRRFASMTTHLKHFAAQTTEPLAIHYRINAGSLPADHWVSDPEQGGGRILGEMCHFVDLASFLTGSQIVEVEANTLGGTGRYNADNVIASVWFANGSRATISYLANGDRAFSKERIEVFGGGSAAVLDDFRRLELVRAGRKQTLRSRWQQDKGHRSEWRAFAESVLSGTESPIRFLDIVSSTLATLRIHESVATGKRYSVDVPRFVEAALQRENNGLPE